jgi:hypothetical protein
MIAARLRRVFRRAPAARVSPRACGATIVP